MKQSKLRLLAIVMVVMMIMILIPGQALADRTPNSITVNTTLPTWGGVTVTVSVTTSGSGEGDDWQSTSYRYDDTGAWRCLDHEPDYTTDGTYQETYTLWVPTDSANGSYTLNMRAHSEDNCGGEVNTFPDNLEPTITTQANNPPFPEVCGLDVLLILDESASIAGPNDIRTDVRNGANTLWNALLGTGSTMSVVEFNRDGRDVSTVQTLPILPGNTSTYTTYINGAGPTSSTRYEPGDYDGADCTNNICATNWQAAFLEAATVNNPAKTLAIFFTDGLPTTNNNFPTNNAGTNYSATEALNHRNVGFAAFAANTLKTAGTRVLAVGIANPSDPTEFLPNVSGPVAFTGDVSTADYTTTVSGDFDDALRAIALEACLASVTVNKSVRIGDTEEFEPAEGWEFTAEVPVEQTDPPFEWTAPAPVSTGTTKTGTTGVNGSLLFQWNPEDPLTPTDITITETQQAGSAFVDVTCQDNSTEPATTIIDGQTTLPVNFDVGATQVIVCEFRNNPGPSAIALSGLDGGAPFDGLPLIWLLAGLGLATVLAVGLARAARGRT